MSDQESRDSSAESHTFIKEAPPPPPYTFRKRLLQPLSPPQAPVAAALKRLSPAEKKLVEVASAKEVQDLEEEDQDLEEEEEDQDLEEKDEKYKKAKKIKAKDNAVGRCLFLGRSKKRGQKGKIALVASSKNEREGSEGNEEEVEVDAPVGKGDCKKKPQAAEALGGQPKKRSLPGKRKREADVVVEGETSTKKKPFSEAAAASFPKRDDEHEDGASRAKKKKKKKKAPHAPQLTEREEQKRKDKGIAAVVVVGEVEGKLGGCSKPDLFERVWSEEDELVFIQIMADYKVTTGLVPSTKNPSFMELLENGGLLNTRFTKEQIFNKIRSCKRKFHNYHKKKNIMFRTAKEKKLFHLINTVWGDGDGLSSSLVSKQKSRIGGAGTRMINDEDQSSASLAILEQLFLEGLVHVESSKERQDIENKWNKLKFKFAKIRSDLLQLVTFVSTMTAQSLLPQSGNDLSSEGGSES